MVLFPLFLGFVFTLWRVTVNYASARNSWPSCRKDKYFVLRGRSRGEILEVSVGAAQSNSDSIVLRAPGSGDDSQAEYLLSDVELISDEVAELLSAIASPEERPEVLGDSERLETSRTRIGHGSRVLVKLAEDEIPGVVLYKGSVGGLGGTLFAVQLKEEDHDIDSERTVLFKGKTYFGRKSDPNVLVCSDRRVLVPIRNLCLHRARRTLQSPRQRPMDALVAPSSPAGEAQAEAATENTPMSRDTESTATGREYQTAEEVNVEESGNPIKRRRHEMGRAYIREALTLLEIRRRKRRGRVTREAMQTTPIVRNPVTGQAAAWWFPLTSPDKNSVDSAPSVTTSERRSASHQPRRLAKRSLDPVPVTRIPEKEEDDLLPGARRSHQSSSADYRSLIDDIPRPPPQRRLDTVAARSAELSEVLPTGTIPEPTVDREVGPVSSSGTTDHKGLVNDMVRSPPLPKLAQDLSVASMVPEPTVDRKVGPVSSSNSTDYRSLMDETLRPPPQRRLETAAARSTELSGVLPAGMFSEPAVDREVGPVSSSSSTDYGSLVDDMARPPPQRKLEIVASDFLLPKLSENLSAPMVPEPTVDRKVGPASSSNCADYRSLVGEMLHLSPQRRLEIVAARAAELSLELPAPVVPKTVDRKVGPSTDARPMLSKAPAAEGQRPLELGQRVVAFDATERIHRGRVRYISDQKDQRGNITLGIELDEPHGFGTGMRKGTRYFTCLKDHALFVPIGAALSEEDFEGRPPATKNTEADVSKVLAETPSAHSNNAEDLIQKAREDRSNFPVHRGLARGVPSLAQNEASWIKMLEGRCNMKDRQLSWLREELHEMEAAKRMLARELREERRNFERERINLLRSKSPAAVDWTIQRHEVHVTNRCLGKGGWATVSVGLFRGTKVAVKKIHDLILSDFNRELFQREMQMASRCRHPCLLQFIGATGDDGPALLVTELLDTSLRKVLNQRSLTKAEINSIALDVSRGLNYLHLSSPSPIIHRDVSSANVLLWRAGDCWRAKLSDYGTANFMRQCRTANPGAPLYVAPEALDVRRQSPKMDVYSFGMLLCEMCIRRLPTVARQEQQVQINQVSNTSLRSLVSRCVREDEERRPTMADVLRTVEELGSKTAKTVRR